MSKKKNATKSQKKMVAARRSTNPTIPRLRAALDAHAVAWARLLEDPCNAPLTYPCYTTGGGGTVLMRMEYDTILWSGATETAGMLFWSPGSSLGFFNQTPQTADTTPSTFAGINTPGSAWLPANAGSFRAVAACMQVMYPGTELNRSGVAAIGVVPAETFITNVVTANGGGNGAIATSVVRTICAHSERMPSTLLEAKWFPGESDQNAIAGALPNATTASYLNGRNAIALSVSGFPVSTGVRVRMVAVYEVSLYTFAGGLGSVQSVAPPQSVNTVSQVVRALFNKDPEWWLNTAVKVGRSVSNAISYARAGVKAAGVAVNGLAMIAA